MKQEAKNIKSLIQDKEKRKVILVTFGVLTAAVIYSQMRQNAETTRPKELAAAVNVVNTPNLPSAVGVATDPRSTGLINGFNKDKARDALATGSSATPVLTNPVTAGTDPLDSVDMSSEKLPPVQQKAVEQKVERASGVIQQKSRELIAAEDGMEKSIKDIMSGWTPNRVVAEFSYSGKEVEEKHEKTASVSNLTDSSTTNQVKVSKAPDVKAGEIWNAVVLTAVNSDEPGPVLAQIVTGPYAGWRLLGKFERPSNAEKVILSFSTITNPKGIKSDSIQAYAVDSESARTALASDVDRHYLSRYGALLGAAFLKGYSQAISQSGTTQTVSIGQGGASTSTTYPELSNQRIAEVAVGEVGNELAQALRSNVNRPVTVSLNSGVAVGILFMKDAVLSKN